MIGFSHHCVNLREIRWVIIAPLSASWALLVILAVVAILSSLTNDTEVSKLLPDYEPGGWINPVVDKSGHVQ
jgi:hypothetical protein